MREYEQIGGAARCTADEQRYDQSAKRVVEHLIRADSCRAPEESIDGLPPARWPTLFRRRHGAPAVDQHSFADTLLSNAEGVDRRYHSVGGLSRSVQWCRQRPERFHRRATLLSGANSDYIPQRRLWELLGDQWALHQFEWCVCSGGEVPWCEHTSARRLQEEAPTGTVRRLLEVALYRCAWAGWQREQTDDLTTVYLLQLFEDQHLALLEMISRDPDGVLPQLHLLMPDAFDWRGDERFASAEQLPSFGASALFADLWSHQEPAERHGVFVAMVHMLFSKTQVHRCYSRNFVPMLLERALLYPALWELFEMALLRTLLGNYRHARRRPPLRQRVLLYRLFVAARAPPRVPGGELVLGDDDMRRWIESREAVAYVAAKELFCWAVDRTPVRGDLARVVDYEKVRQNTLAAADSLRLLLFQEGGDATKSSSSSVRALLACLADPHRCGVLLAAHEMTKRLMSRMLSTDSFLEILLRLIDEKHSAERMQPSESFLLTRVREPLGGPARVRAIYALAGAMRQRRRGRRLPGDLSDTAYLKAAGLSEHAFYWVRHLDLVYRTVNVVEYAMRESVIAMSIDTVSFHVLHLLLHLVFLPEHRRMVPVSAQATFAQACALRRKALVVPRVAAASRLYRTLYCNACERISASAVSRRHLHTEVDTAAHGAEEALYDIATGKLMCGRRVATCAIDYHVSYGEAVAKISRPSDAPSIKVGQQQQQRVSVEADDPCEKPKKTWKGSAAARRLEISKLRKLYQLLYKRRDIYYSEHGCPTLLDGTLVDDTNVSQIVRLIGMQQQAAADDDDDDDDDSKKEEEEDDDDDDDEDDRVCRRSAHDRKMNESLASATATVMRVKRAQRSGFGGAQHAVVSAKASYCRDQALLSETLVGAQMRLGSSLWTRCGVCAQPTQLDAGSWSSTGCITCGFHRRHLPDGVPVLSEYSLIRRCRDADVLESARARAAADCFSRPVAAECEWCGYDALHALMGTARCSASRVGPRSNRSGNGKRSAFQVGARPFHRVSRTFGGGLRRRWRMAEASGCAPYIEGAVVSSDPRRRQAGAAQVQRWIEHVVSMRNARSMVGSFVRALPLIGKLDIESMAVMRMMASEVIGIKRRIAEIRELKRRKGSTQPAAAAAAVENDWTLGDCHSEDCRTTTTHDDDESNNEEDLRLASFWDEIDPQELEGMRAEQVKALFGGGGGGGIARAETADDNDEEKELLLENDRVLKRARQQLQMFEMKRRSEGGNGRALLAREMGELREMFGTREVSAQKSVLEVLTANEIFEATEKQCMLYAWEALERAEPADVLERFDRSRWTAAFAAGLSLNALKENGRLATGVRHAYEPNTYTRLRTLGANSDVFNSLLDDYLPQRAGRIDQCPPRLLCFREDDDDEHSLAMASFLALSQAYHFVQDRERTIYTRGLEIAAASSPNRTVFGTGYVPGVHPLRVLHLRMLDVTDGCLAVRDVSLCRHHHLMVENRQLNHGVALPTWLGTGDRTRMHSVQKAWDGEDYERRDIVAEGPVGYGLLFDEARRNPARVALEMMRRARSKNPF